MRSSGSRPRPPATWGNRAEGEALLSLSPESARLSALKPAEDGEGLIARVLNETDEALSARLHLGPSLRGRVAGIVACGLDERAETAEAGPGVTPSFEDGVIGLALPPHAARSLRLRLRPSS